MPAFKFSILQEHAAKPKFGESCNNCGLCCRVQACDVSRHLLRSEQVPCVALEVHDGKFMCGMMLRPEHYCPKGHMLSADELKRVKAMIAEWLAIGYGCTMPDEVGLVAVEEVEA